MDSAGARWDWLAAVGNNSGAGSTLAVLAVLAVVRGLGEAGGKAGGMKMDGEVLAKGPFRDSSKGLEKGHFRRACNSVLYSLVFVWLDPHRHWCAWSACLEPS